MEYFWGEHELFLFVVKRDSLQALTLPVKEQDITRHVETLRSRIKKIMYTQQDVNLTLKLYQQLVQPAEPYLQGTNTLLIVPDGALHYLPFDLFVIPAPDAPANEEVEFSEYHDLNYLIRRYATVYAPSASVLKPDILYHGQDAGQPERTFLALAPFTEEQLAQNAPVVEALRTLSIVEDKQSGQDVELRHLPFSEDEVKTIVTMFASGGQYFLGPEATEQVAHQQGADYRYVHLATHGLIDPDHPMYSGIALYDGLLQMYETFNLDLHADLVALSACETGVGALKRGEGVIGLTRAFMYAGTPSVLVSLWSVDDHSTSVLMTEFYRHLNAGVHKAEALRQAKLALIKQQREGTANRRDVVLWSEQQDEQLKPPSHTHPFYWTPFVLAGGWR